MARAKYYRCTYTSKGDKVIFQQANIINEKVVHQNSDIVKLSEAKKFYQKSLQINFWDCKDLANRPFKVVDPASSQRFKIVSILPLLLPVSNTVPAEPLIKIPVPASILVNVE